MKDKKMLFGIILSFIFLLSVGMTYAYFYVTVSGNEEAKNISASTGTLEIDYDGGPAIIAQEIYPGWTSTKTFTVTNTGSLDAYYSIDWENINNEIIRNELKMSLTCTGVNCKALSEETVGNIDGPFIESIKITPGITHTYELIVTFIETNSEQNYNQDKEFVGTIVIRESFEGEASLFNMYGTLVDESDAPIAGATMTLMSEPKTTITDENGNFVFEDVEADNHTITAIVEGEEILSDSLTIINGERTEINDTTITRREKTNQINVKIKANVDKSIATIDLVHNTLSPDWATILGIVAPDIIAIPIETTIDSPATYTFNGTTYNRNQNGVDVSENADGSVLASTYTDDIDETDVIVMINSKGMVSLPEDSTSIFSSDNRECFLNIMYIQTENLDTSSVINMSSMFYNTGFDSDTFDLDLSNWDTSQVINMYGMFDSAGHNMETWSIEGLSDLDTSNVIDMSSMFSNTGSISDTFVLDLSNWDTSQVTNMSEMFCDAGRNATTFNLDLSNWDTSQVTNMSSMFSNAGETATSVTLNIRGFNLSNSNTILTNYLSMFYYMKSNAQITVGSTDSKDWILGLSGSDRPSAWTTDNIIVDDTIPTNNSVSISE